MNLRVRFVRRCIKCKCIFCAQTTWINIAQIDKVTLSRSFITQASIRVQFTIHWKWSVSRWCPTGYMNSKCIHLQRTFPFHACLELFHQQYSLYVYFFHKLQIRVLKLVLSGIFKCAPLDWCQLGKFPGSDNCFN